MNCGCKEKDCKCKDKKLPEWTKAPRWKKLRKRLKKDDKGKK